MKTFLMGALAVAVAGASVAFAEEDDGIVSAAPVVADPVNPQPGMLGSAYNIRIGSFESVVAQLSSAPSVKNFVDTSSDFGRKSLDRNMEISIIKWEGFVKCKKAGVYSFSFEESRKRGGLGDYCFELNGEKLIKGGDGQQTVAGKLKIGWNKVIIAYTAWSDTHVLKLRYKPNGSLSEPRLLTPGMLFYDKPVEEEW